MAAAGDRPDRIQAARLGHQLSTGGESYPMRGLEIPACCSPGLRGAGKNDPVSDVHLNRNPTRIQRSKSKTVFPEPASQPSSWYHLAPGLLFYPPQQILRLSKRGRQPVLSATWPKAVWGTCTKGNLKVIVVAEYEASMQVRSAYRQEPIETIKNIHFGADAPLAGYRFLRRRGLRTPNVGEVIYVTRQREQAHCRIGS